MRTILSLRRHHYLNRVGIFLIAIALVVGVVGYGGTCGKCYLTIGSTAGGGVTTPGEGTYTYDCGTEVDLVATPECGYVFDKWLGDTGDIDNVNAAATKIGVYDHPSITANFEPLPLDHFRCYVAGGSPLVDVYVDLEDQFGIYEDAQVLEATLFCNPVKKVHDGITTPISCPDHHLTVYSLDYEGDYVTRSVEVSNQFGTHNLTVEGPYMLAVPTQKLVPGGHEEPVGLDHFLVYDVMGLPEEIGAYVDLDDQFGSEEGVGVYYPVFFANLVKKTHDGVVTDIVDPEEHLVFYSTDSKSVVGTQVEVGNQFGEPQDLDLTYSDLLAVPSQKIVPPALPLDHFKCYMAEGPPLVGVYVDLEDQFGIYEDAQVLEATLFCNPVKKVHDGITTPISDPDNHLTVYSISTSQQTWDVLVDHQFGGWLLRVAGPIGLAVPTQKVEPGGHDLPKYLDHFLLYSVTAAEPMDVTVDLDDQFPGTAPGVTVTTPVYFATPALKEYVGNITAPWNPDEHLVFYFISSNPEFLSSVVVNNQFQGPVSFNLDNIEYLAVPSVKVSYAPVP